MIYQSIAYLSIVYLFCKAMKWRHNSELLKHLDLMKEYKEKHGESEEFKKILEVLEQTPRFN